MGERLKPSNKAGEDRGVSGLIKKALGVHRRMVRAAIGSALPKPRKKTE
jgi:hypothetical protein